MLAVLERLGSLLGDEELGPGRSLLGPAAGATWGHRGGPGTGDGAQQQGVRATPTTSAGRQGHRPGAARAGAEQPLQ